MYNEGSHITYAPGDLGGSAVWNMDDQPVGAAPITPTHAPGCGYWWEVPGGAAGPATPPLVSNVLTKQKLFYNEGNLISSYANPVWDNSHIGRKSAPITPNHSPGCGYWPVGGGGTSPIIIGPNDGGLYGEGNSSYGQLNSGSNLIYSSLKKLASDTYTAIACSFEDTLLINTVGELWGAGKNTYGILGLGDHILRWNFTLIDVGPWRSVSCGRYHVAAIKNDGTLWVSGYNGQGGLGLNDLTNRNILTQVGVSLWVSVSCHGTETIAIRDDGLAFGTGTNIFGGLGLGDKVLRKVFTQIGTDTWTHVAGGYLSAVLIKSDGTLWGTGYNPTGALGLGDNTDRSVLTQISNDIWVDLDCSDVGSTLAIKNDGSLWGTGYNGVYQLGLNDNVNRNILTHIGSGLWKSVSCGYNHTLLLDTEDLLWGMGDGSSASMAPLLNPTKVPTQINTFNWILVKGGVQNTLGIRKDQHY